MSPYKLLFRPIRLGPVTVRNRVVFSAHLTNFAQDNRPGERLIDYYRERARGGVFERVEAVDRDIVAPDELGPEAPCQGAGCHRMGHGPSSPAGLGSGTAGVVASYSLFISVITSLVISTLSLRYRIDRRKTAAFIPWKSC